MGDGLGVGDTVGEGDGDTVGEGVADGDGVTVGEDTGVVAVGLGVGVEEPGAFNGVGSGVPAGALT